MKKEYIAPIAHRYVAQPLMISVSSNGPRVDNPADVESREIWGGSLFDDDIKSDNDHISF